MTYIKILTTYIASWAWTVISVIFLCTGALFLAEENTSIDYILFFSFFAMFLFCFYMGMKRKKEVYEDE